MDRIADKAAWQPNGIIRVFAGDGQCSRQLSAVSCQLSARARRSFLAQSVRRRANDSLVCTPPVRPSPTLRPRSGPSAFTSRQRNQVLKDTRPVRGARKWGGCLRHFLRIDTARELKTRAPARLPCGAGGCCALETPAAADPLNGNVVVRDLSKGEGSKFRI